MVVRWLDGMGWFEGKMLQVTVAPSSDELGTMMV